MKEESNNWHFDDTHIIVQRSHPSGSLQLSLFHVSGLQHEMRFADLISVRDALTQVIDQHGMDLKESK